MTDQPMAAYCGTLEAEIKRLRIENEQWKVALVKQAAAVDRRAVIEECAQLVEREAYDYDDMVRLAAAIRALKEKP